MIPNDETVRVLRAIHALLADALTSPNRGPGASESDDRAGQAPAHPHTRERPPAGDPERGYCGCLRPGHADYSCTKPPGHAGPHGYAGVFWWSQPGPADDLPGEPVEPGDLRAGDRVAFTYDSERITCTLASSPPGSALISDTPGASGYRPGIVARRGGWCFGIFDVRLIERAPREDDEALADLIGKTLWPDDPPWAERGTEARDRLPEPEGVSAVEDGPADDGLAEWERELFRPATYCGKCPPIAGGGYDCTCEGNPRCEKADTPEEWHGNPAPADVDPDEALALAICHSLDFAESSMLGEAVTAAVKDVLAAGWFPDVERLTRERDFQTARADDLGIRVQKSEARHAALREDAEEVVAHFEEHPTAGVHPRHVARRIRWVVLDRDDERDEQ